MNRTQQVKFLNALSIVGAIPACVPQVRLSPLCYLTFISMTWKIVFQMNFRQSHASTCMVTIVANTKL